MRRTSLLTILLPLLTFPGAACSSSNSGSCNIAPLPDGGRCTDDSQCPSGDYCDLVPTPCLGDAGYTISTVSGICLPSVTGNSCCHTGEDCGSGGTCLFQVNANEQSICNLSQPCSNGFCGASPCSGPAACPTGCHNVFLPHVCYGGYPCVCPGNSCTPPVVDGG